MFSKRFKKLLFLFCPSLVALLLLFLCHSVGLRLNLSGSLPHRLYRVRFLADAEEIRRGDIVVFDHLKSVNGNLSAAVVRGYLSANTPMLKRVLAVPGDTVELRNNGIAVNGAYAEHCVLLSQDSHGNILSVTPTPLTLREGFYWLSSDPERGFDSRYFGPVGKQDLSHRAFPIF